MTTFLEPEPMQSFAGIDQRLKVHLAYAKVFDDALTETDLIEYCDPTDPEGVRRSLEALEADGLIERHDGYCFLSGHVVEGWAATVSERRRVADELLAENRPAIRWLGRLPWVRLLAVSGSLARHSPRHVPGAAPDLDLFIITEPASVHIVRLIARVVSLGRRLLARATLSPPPPRLCLNYVTESSFLEVTNKSLFTASDALHVRVFKNPGEHRRFLGANAWIGRYFPVREADPTDTDESASPGVLRSAVNLACFLAMGSAQWLKGRIIGRRFLYSFRQRLDRPHSIRRVVPEGGGYQPQVAERFRRIYRSHFGVDEWLEGFLFPGTTSTGIYVDGAHVRSTVVSRLALDE